MKPSDFLAEPGSEAFERCRRIVARERKWKPENVMDWEVRSYIRMKGEEEAPIKHFNPTRKAKPSPRHKPSARS